MRCVAVDWSGRSSGAEEYIWVAEVCGGRIVELRNGRAPEAVIAHLLALAAADRELVVGLDFAFSFPRWYCEQRRWRTGAEVWAAMAAEGEQLLAAEADPFWGRTRGRPQGQLGLRALRRTDLEDAPGAKSPFQIGGAGAVGTGSIRGMPWLAVLAGHGFSVWPLHGRELPAAVEIYPRMMYGAGVVKTRWSVRHAVLSERFAEQPAELLERAAGSEDAFDAAVSALVMAQHCEQLRRLAPEPAYALEGRVWAPSPSVTGR